MTHAIHRTYDGRDNGAPGRNSGAAGQELRDLGVDPVPFDPTRRPAPRSISNAVFHQRHAVTRSDPWGRSEFVWAWGQFLDHELDLIEHDGGRRAPILIPDDDPLVEFRGRTMQFQRSTSLENHHTAYVDAGNVYGTTQEHADHLRDGARLRTTTGPDGPLMPKNDRPYAAPGPGGEERYPDNAGPGGPAQRGRYFLAGDVRANEHAVLSSLHSLFVREHNRLVSEIQRAGGGLSQSHTFERARKFLGAFMQAITYNEFLPALLGRDAIPVYRGFKLGVDAGISNLFATACYRIGHTMVRDDVRLSIGGRKIPLDEVFFAPELIEWVGIGPFLEPLATRRMAALDATIVEGLRSNLFRAGSLDVLDLAALNIQRGRDHGLGDFNAFRKALGLAAVADLDDLTGDTRVASRVRRVYGDTMDGLDVWVGALAERPQPHNGLGELMEAALVDQFTRTRDGDHYWYENDPYFTADERAEIAATRLSDILRRNIGGIDVPDDVFRTAHV